MHSLSKREALEFIRVHAAVLDSPSNDPNPFASSDWTRHFIEQIVEDDWRVLAFGDGPASTSLMLAYHQAATPARCMALANYYTSLYSPLSSLAADRAIAMRAVARELSGARPRIATIKFAPLDAQSADTTALLEELGGHGWYAKRYFAFGNWTLPCDGLGFDEYMATRDSQVRNTYLRKSKKMLASGSVAVITEPADVEAAMDAYEAIYDRSWKQREPYPDFVRGWARRCASRGWLRLGIASVQGQPIAAQFWFTVARRAYIFKLAYDETYSKWSAGTVLTAHMIRHALDVDRVVEIDYLTGDDAYKSTWMTHRRERIGVLACNLRSPHGLLAAAIEMAGALSAPLRGRIQGLRAPRPEPA